MKSSLLAAILAPPSHQTVMHGIALLIGISLLVLSCVITVDTYAAWISGMPVSVVMGAIESRFGSVVLNVGLVGAMIAAVVVSTVIDRCPPRALTPLGMGTCFALIASALTLHLGYGVPLPIIGFVGIGIAAKLLDSVPRFSSSDGH